MLPRLMEAIKPYQLPRGELFDGMLERIAAMESGRDLDLDDAQDDDDADNVESSGS